MKKIIISVLFFQVLFFQPDALAEGNTRINNEKKPLITSVFSNIEQSNKGLKFPIFTELSEYARPAVFSLKKVNRSLFLTIRETSSLFKEKILPVYGLSSYVFASSKKH